MCNVTHRHLVIANAIKMDTIQSTRFVSNKVKSNRENIHFYDGRQYRMNMWRYIFVW
jgi:hypothetical protein